MRVVAVTYTLLTMWNEKQLKWIFRYILFFFSVSGQSCGVQCYVARTPTSAHQVSGLNPYFSTSGQWLEPLLQRVRSVARTPTSARQVSGSNPYFSASGQWLEPLLQRVRSMARTPTSANQVNGMNPYFSASGQLLEPLLQRIRSGSGMNPYRHQVSSGSNV